MKFKGKKAIISGGTRGIGRSIAVRLAQEGCELALGYLDKIEAAEETVKLVNGVGGTAHLVQANLRDLDETKSFVNQSAEKLGSFDFFIHSAALGTFKKTSELKTNQWDLSMDINVKSFLVMSQGVRKHMPNGGVMIALSSSGSTKVVPNYGAIGVSKAALESLVRYLSVDLIPDGIRVNAVSGGFIDTQSLNAFPQYEVMKQEAIKRTPAGRIGTAEDLSGIVAFLCSDDAKWIVGQTILADGGLGLV